MAKKIGRRVDVLAKVTGKARYANDLKFPNMLYAKTVRAPYPHAKIISIEREQAEQYPGVVKVITADNIPGIPSQYKQKPILVPEVVRYVGEGVALVVAESMDIAEEASRLVKVNYEELPAVTNPEDALKEGAPRVYEDGNLLCEYHGGKGDVEEGFKKADQIFEREYSTHRVDHMPIEPEVAVAVPTVEGVTVYSPTNDAYKARLIVAETLGYNENQVRFILPTVGGSFGAKNYDAGLVGARAALAAVLTGKPVKLTFTREESLVESTKRHPYICKHKVGVTNSGEITAMEINLIGDGGAYVSKSHPVATRTLIEASGPYIVPNVKTTVKLAFTNNTYSDAMRGFGSPQVDFASEVLFDEIACELNMDPYEFKKMNHLKENDVSGVGQVMTDVSLGKCLDEVIKASNWKERRAQLALEREKGGSKVRGLGLSIIHRGEAFGAAGQGIDTAEVSMLINWDGSITINSSLADVGMGGQTMLVNVVMETLGVNRERIVVNPVDTNYVPNSGPSSATRGTMVIGNAARLAAEEVKDKIAVIAAEILGVLKEELVFKNEKIYSLSKFEADEHVNYLDMISAIFSRGQTPSGHGWYSVEGLKWDRALGNGEAYLSYAYGAGVAEVEVDLETGQVSVENFVADHDVGHAFDKNEVIGQINGGVSMAVGYGIFEDVESKNGYMKNTNFDKYLIPTVLDMPEMNSIVVEVPSKTGPFGARGLGEPSACTAAPAIINAIYDATGVRIRELPASLEKVLFELRKKQNKAKLD